MRSFSKRNSWKKKKKKKRNLRGNLLKVRKCLEKPFFSFSMLESTTPALSIFLGLPPAFKGSIAQYRCSSTTQKFYCALSAPRSSSQDQPSARIFMVNQRSPLKQAWESKKRSLTQPIEALLFPYSPLNELLFEWEQFHKQDQAYIPNNKLHQLFFIAKIYYCFLDYSNKYISYKNFIT